MKAFSECNEQNPLRAVEKSWKNQTVWSQKSFKKKRHILTIFPRPGESDPYENNKFQKGTSLIRPFCCVVLLCLPSFLLILV